MRTTAPGLAPIFRSEEQLRILGRLFAGPGDELAVGQLAAETGVAVSTASREVARLAAHGLVRTRQVGRTRLVAASWDLPWAAELRSLLTKTVGVLGVLTEALAALPDIQQAAIFGSWAARYTGAPGPFPRDVDLVVIGAPDRRLLNDACRHAEATLGVQVNPVVATSGEWSHPKAGTFLAQVKAGPLVEIPLDR